MNKRIPIRTCIGCGKEGSKQEFVRIVRNKEGDMAVDPAGSMSGRGTYLCRDTACFDKAVKKRGFARTFRAAISDETINALRPDFEAAVQDEELR